MATRWQWLDRLRALMGYRFPHLGRRIFEAFFHYAPSQQEVELFPNLYVDLNLHDGTQKTTYWQGARYEHPAARILANWIRDGAVFFDIGANYGFFSYWMLSQGNPVTVYAFDPVPENAAKMERARRRNSLAHRFTVAECALGDSMATMVLRTGGDDSGHSTLGNHPGLGGRTFDVSVVPFDAWIIRSGLQLPSEPTWIAKIDVEGFEYHVLRGMRAALQARAFAGLMIEINPYTLSLFGQVPEDVFSFLAEMGYASNEHQKLQGMKSGDWFNAFFVPAFNAGL
jgi:FkbM family methyltransferase